MPTPRQLDVLTAIYLYEMDHAYTPSFVEIAGRCGMSSLATVHKHVSNLEAAQLLRRNFNRSRSIELMRRGEALAKVGAKKALMETATAIKVLPPLSQSKQTLMACAHLYNARIVEGVIEPPNEYSLRGTQIHEVLSAYINHLVASRQGSDLAHFDHLLASAPYLSETIEILQNMRDSLRIDPEKVLDTEIHISLDANMELCEPDGQAEYEGTLDFVQLLSASEAEIWDWKSYYAIIDADTFQSKLYPLLLFKAYPSLDKVSFHLKFVQYGATRRVEYTRDDVPKLEALARGERKRQISLHSAGAKHSQAMPGTHCAYCPLLNSTCPVKAQNPYAEMSPEDRVRFGTWLIQAKKRNDEILKAFALERGAIATKDDNGTEYVAQYTLSEKSSFPLSESFPIVSEHDPELVAKLTISGLSTPLKAKKRAEMAKLLEPLKVVKAQTKFSIKGSGEKDEFGDE